MLDMDTRRTDPARIAVIGLGGGGSNAVNRMVTEGLKSVTFWVANTDAQALEASPCPNRHQLGTALTGGLGAGGDPEIGRAAAEEDSQFLAEMLEGYDMVFITAGMGGGTGTGAAPVVARIARGLGALTVGIVTRPFTLEGARRTSRAEEGILQLTDEVDTLIVIPNDKLLHLVDRSSTFDAGLRMADEVLFQSTRGISDVIVGNGLINVDFADVRTVMRNRGAALLGCGVASGPSRANDAAQKAIASPLLDDLSIQGAEALLINIVGGPDMGFHEVTEAARFVTEQAGKDCDVFMGAVIDPHLGSEMRVTIIATGFQRTPAIRLVERPAAKTRVPAPAAGAGATARALPPLPEIPIPASLPAVEPLEPERIAAYDPPDWESPMREPITEPTREPMPGPMPGPAWSDARAETRIEIPQTSDGLDRWIEDPAGEQAPATEPAAPRGPALWRRSPSRRLRLPDADASLQKGDGNRYDTPTFFRKGMD